MGGQLSFTAKLRLRSNGVSPASWHFVTLPKKITNDIKKQQLTYTRKGRGWIKVKVQIGFCSRTTSIFPDKKSGSYVLPIKASVRKELQIQEGSEVLIYLTVL